MGRDKGAGKSRRILFVIIPSKQFNTLLSACVIMSIVMIVRFVCFLVKDTLWVIRI